MLNSRNENFIFAHEENLIVAGKSPNRARMEAGAIRNLFETSEQAIVEMDREKIIKAIAIQAASVYQRNGKCVIGVVGTLTGMVKNLALSLDEDAPVKGLSVTEIEPFLGFELARPGKSTVRKATVPVPRIAPVPNVTHDTSLINALKVGCKEVRLNTKTGEMSFVF